MAQESATGLQTYKRADSSDPGDGSTMSTESRRTTIRLTYGTAVGTGTYTQRYPLGAYYGYERSASLYTASELAASGSLGKISQVAWYAMLSRTTSIPIKIYLKETTSTSLTADTWANMINGATLVYNSTMTNINADAWNIFSLSTQFPYNGSQNLMVLVETNYGSTGAGIGSSSPSVRYTSTTSCHQYWQQDNSAPTTNGTVSNYRPNIIITSECPYFTSSTTTSYITKFSTTGAVVNVSNETTGTGQTYNDYYNSQSFTAAAGATINTNVEMSESSATYGIAIWVDWNNNGVFETSEKMFGTTGYTYSPITGSFTVPSGQTAGSYRVRVMADWLTPAPSDPCECVRGEVEDYKLIVGTSPCSSIQTMYCGQTYNATLQPSGGYWTNYTGSSLSWSGSEQVWEFTAPTTGSYTFNLNEGSADADFFLMSACDPNSTNLSNGYWYGGSSGSSETVTLTGGVTYYLIADLYSSSSSTTVTVSVDCPSPCNPITLVSDVPVTTSTIPTDYKFTNGSNCTSIVSILPQGNDHDLNIYDEGCRSGNHEVGSSYGGTTNDFVMFYYYNSDPHYPSVTYGSTGSTIVEYENSSGQMLSVGTAKSGTMTTSEAVDMYEIYLTEGACYDFNLDITSGGRDLGFAFANPNSSTPWKSRSSCTVVDATTTGGVYGDEALNGWICPASDWYGVAVFNNYATGGASSNYTIKVSSCCTPPTNPIASGTTSICGGSSTSISATSTNATTIYWYTGSCGGSQVGTSSPSSNFSVSPTTTTTYYARGYNSAGGGCWSSGCGSVTVTVIPSPTISAISATPSTICVGGSSMLNATSTGNTINWWNAASGGTNLSTSESGANYTVTPSSTTTYYAEAETATSGGSPSTLTTTFAAGNGFHGNMFDVNVLNNIVVNSFDVHAPVEVYDYEVYYKTGTWVGFEANSSAWTLIGAANGIVGNGVGVATPLNLNLNLSLTAEQTYAFYVTSTGGSIKYTDGTAVGNICASNSDIQIEEGWGGAYLFGTPNTPRIWNGTIRYQLAEVGCTSNSRTAVTVTVVADPSATATGTTSICEGGTATYSVSCTGGTGTPTYQWYFKSPSAVSWSPLSDVLSNAPCYDSVSGATSSSLTLGLYNFSSACSGYQVYCEVSYSGSGCNQAISNIITTTVNATNTVSAASSTPTLCINTSLTAITHTTTGATGIGTATGLPAGVTATWASNTITISGTPTASGTFNYNIPLIGGCGSVTATGTITVTPNSSAGTVSAGTTPQCIGQTTTYTVSGVVLGGGTGSWSSSNTAVATVNSSTGLVTAVSAGTCNIIYTVTGGCSGTKSASASYTVTPTAAITSVTAGTTPQCIGSTTTYTAHGVVLGGGTGAWSSSNTSVATVNSSGLVTAVGAGTCNITYTITGGCGGTKSASASYIVNADHTLSSASSESVCINTAISNIQISFGGGATSASVSGLPNGVSASISGSTLTISGVPTQNGVYNYTVTTSGNACATASVNGTITVNPPSTTGLTLATNDYLWYGKSGTDWGTDANWLKYNGSNFETTSIPTSTNNVIISNISGTCNSANQPVVSLANGVCNNLFIASGASVSMSNAQTLNIKGNWTNTGTFTAGDGTVIFNGTSLQVIKAGGSAFNNVKFENSAGFNVNEAMTINGNADFNNGIVNFMTAGSLTFSNSATSNIGNSTSYVNGIITKTGSSAFNFATGDGVYWGPCGIAAPSASSTITAQYFHLAGPLNWTFAYMCPASNLHHTSGVEHWLLNSDASTPNVTLYWNTASIVVDPNTLVVSHFNSSTNCWENKGAANITGNANAGSVTNAIPFTSYSPITLGTKTEINPLPVELTLFSAECDNNNNVQLYWTTASEINNDYFEIQRSTDDLAWEVIETVQGAGFSNTSLNYDYLDRENPNANTYYRLRQVDYDGRSKFSDIISIRCENNMEKPTISIYPNPFNSILNIEFKNWDMKSAEIELVDITSRTIKTWKLENTLQNFVYEVNLNNLNPAMYMLKIKTSSGVIMRKIEKQ